MFILGFRAVQQRYVVVVMMFLSMTFTFLLRMSFPIVLTQMVYIPNINSSSSMNATTDSNSELICPVKNHMLNNTTADPDPLVSFSVIYSFFINERFISMHCSLFLRLLLEKFIAHISDRQAWTIPMVTETTRSRSVIILLGQYSKWNSKFNTCSTHRTQNHTTNFDHLIGNSDGINTTLSCIWYCIYNNSDYFH